MEKAQPAAISLGSTGDDVIATDLGGTVPEPSTWVMMILGFAGLGFVGYPGSRRNATAPA